VSDPRPPAAASSLPPRLGTPSLALLVVASMIGAGVFTTSGFALADLGTPMRVIAAWIVGGFVALCGAMGYAALARRMTESGGEYLFLSRAIHPAAGFVAGWVSLIAGFTSAIAFAATAFESYAIPEGTRPGWLPPGGMAVALITLCALLHGVRLKPGVVAQNVKVALKLALLAGFLIFALTQLGDGDVWRGGPVLEEDATAPAPFDPLAFATTLMWISLSYSGFNAAIYVAGEARDAARAVPRAMIIATLAVTALYVAINAVFVLAPAPQEVAGREDVATVAAAALGGEALAESLRWLIALALFTSVSSMIMTGPRVYAKMAEDGVFPRFFRIGADVPAAAVWLQVLLAGVVVLIAGLPELLSYLGFTLSLSAAATVASVFVLKRREGRRNDHHGDGAARSMWAPGYPVVPAMYIGFTLLFASLAATRRPWEAGAAVITIGSGLVVYAVMQRLRGGSAAAGA